MSLCSLPPPAPGTVGGWGGVVVLGLLVCVQSRVHVRDSRAVTVSRSTTLRTCLKPSCSSPLMMRPARPGSHTCVCPSACPRRPPACGRTWSLLQVLTRTDHAGLVSLASVTCLSASGDAEKKRLRELALLSYQDKLSSESSFRAQSRLADSRYALKTMMKVTPGVSVS